MNREETLSLLESILETQAKKGERRSEILLKSPKSAGPHTWYMFLPSAFDDIIDIKLTEKKVNKKPVNVWTQGTSFCFTQGHTIYDTPKAYSDEWAESLKHINLCVQVTGGISAIPGKRRISGHVEFDILKPTSHRDKLVVHGHMSMSQDDFVRFLIGGPSEEMKTIIRNE